VWNIDSAILNTPVPSLILQPLVENAIQHGIGSSLDRGRLEIIAAGEGDRIRLEVRDNGPGLGGSAEPTGSGIGLVNTRARLQRLYGSRSTFQLTNDRGLVVSILLPRLA
jgi:sensor histidine kinase YesM